MAIFRCIKVLKNGNISLYKGTENGNISLYEGAEKFSTKPRRE